MLRISFGRYLGYTAGKLLKDPNRRPLRSRHRAHDRTRVHTYKPPKRAPRRLQDAFTFSILFWCRFGSMRGRFSAPTWHQKSTKIDQKSMPRGTPFSTTFFGWFLIDFWSIFRPNSFKKSITREINICIKFQRQKLRSGWDDPMQGRGRGKSLPEGRREGVETRYSMLNHLSPEGWLVGFFPVSKSYYIN